MANTGYQISPTVRQYFTSGPNSGSVVTASYDVDLTVSPFSASLDNEDYFYRAFNPIDCEPGFEDCLVPLLTSLVTGSRRGRFGINYVTQSGFNPPLDITASVSNDPNFGTSEIFSASIGDIIPVSTSFTSGTIYFQAFTSCSGPDPSPNSDPLSFTYDLLPPRIASGSVNIVFKNNLSSPMEVLIRSTRGNANYKISAGNSITYDYSTAPDASAWTSTGRSDDLSVTIKGGSRSTYGNFVQRTTVGIEKETYTTGGGFDSPTSDSDNSSIFTPDKGVTFDIRQLVRPTDVVITTTTFTLLTQTPPAPAPTVLPAPSPGPGPAPDPTPYVETVFGSTPYATQDDACAATNVNFREKTYFKRSGYLYNTNSDALDNTKATFPNNKNYILIDSTTYLIVNKDGYIQNRGGCILPTIEIFTVRGAYPSQEAACRRKKVTGTTFSYKDNKLVGSNLSGRYPLYSGTPARGGRNVILSAGRIVGYETCGSELTTVQYGSVGYLNSIYPLQTPDEINPRTLNRVCNTELKPYSLGPSGVVYYHVDTPYAYVPLGLGRRWYKTENGDFVNFNKGEIIDNAEEEA